MARKRHTAEEIVTRLRQVDVLTAQGRPVADAIRSIGVTEVTYYRWRNEYGGLRPHRKGNDADDPARRCRQRSRCNEADGVHRHSVPRTPKARTITAP